MFLTDVTVLTMIIKYLTALLLSSAKIRKSSALLRANSIPENAHLVETNILASLLRSRGLLGSRDLLSSRDLPPELKHTGLRKRITTIPTDGN